MKYQRSSLFHVLSITAVAVITMPRTTVGRTAPEFGAALDLQIDAVCVVVTMRVWTAAESLKEAALWTSVARAIKRDQMTASQTAMEFGVAPP